MARLQLQQVGAFFVLVGLHQLIGAVRQDVDELVGVVEPCGDDVEVVIAEKGARVGGRGGEAGVE